jgi:xanthosine utilization system XapX-like protein
VTAHLYFLLGAVMLLLVFFLWIRAGLRHEQNRDAYEVYAEEFKRDSLAAGLSARIFSSEDSEFVASKTCASIARAFRKERTTLALEWLRGVRTQVNCLFRSHLQAARQNPDLKPAGELRLGMHFLAFQLTTGILYIVIRVRGPVPAARLLLLSLELSERVLRMAKDVLPSTATAVSAELLGLDPHANDRGSAR